MSDSVASERTAPPYVAVQSLWNFLGNLKQAPPPKIDRSLMKSIGGSTQAQLIHALKVLDLITEDSSVTPRLNRLIVAEGEDRKTAIKQLVEEKYPFILGQTGFDLSKATGKQLADEFTTHWGVGGDTSKKCQRFFLSLAVEAGYTVSPYIKAPTTSSSSGTRNKRPRRGRKSADDTSGTPAPPVEQNKNGTPQVETAASIRERFLFEKMPGFDPKWSKGAQESWVNVANALLAGKTLSPEQPSHSGGNEVDEDAKG